MNPSCMVDQAGFRLDLSDRPLVCCSSDGRNEVVVGGTDHALYSIDTNDLRRKPVTMYTKTSGHTDWVTSATHLANGQVLSAAMDGKLCLWSRANRRICVNLNRGSTHPISKVMGDEQHNAAVSLGYDGNIEVWRFGEADFDAPRNAPAIRGRFGSTATSSSGSGSSIVPISVLSNHTQPVLDGSFLGSRLVSGDKGGSLVIWDVHTGQPLHRFRAHPGAITNVCFGGDEHTVLSAGVDGYVKVWDPRTSGSGMVHKILAHSTQDAPTQRMPGPPSARPAAGRGAGPSAPTGCPVSTMALLFGRGGAASPTYLATGGGSEMDSSVALFDFRRSCEQVARWTQPRNGVYSLSVMGNDCILAGDGVGSLLCYGVQSGANLRDPRQCLKYLVGASERGAVRAICCLENKVVTVGEDGKVLVFQYQP